MKQVIADDHNSLVKNALYDGNSPMPLYEHWTNCTTKINVMQKTTSFDWYEAQIATPSNTHIHVYNNNKQGDHSKMGNVHDNESYGIWAPAGLP